MAQIKMIPFPKTRMFINRSGQFAASVLLQSEEIIMKDGFIHKTRRIVELESSYNTLQKMMEISRTSGIPGKIVVQERTESQLPNSWLFKKDDHVKMIEGKVCIKDGERVFRRNVWDKDDIMVDIYLKHDMLVSYSLKKPIYSEETLFTGEKKIFFGFDYLIRERYVKTTPKS